MIGIGLGIGSSVASHKHIGPAHTKVSAPAAGGADIARVGFQQLNLHFPWHGRLGYGVSEAVFYFAGTAGGSKGNSVSMATLPPAARPTRQLDLVVSLGQFGSGVIQVTPDRQISVFSSRGDYGFVSLDGVSFPLGI